MKARVSSLFGSATYGPEMSSELGVIPNLSRSY